MISEVRRRKQLSLLLCRARIIDFPSFMNLPSQRIEMSLYPCRQVCDIILLFIGSFYLTMKPVESLSATSFRRYYFLASRLSCRRCYPSSTTRWDETLRPLLITIKIYFFYILIRFSKEAHFAFHSCAAAQSIQKGDRGYGIEFNNHSRCACANHRRSSL
jgi:hypothetical protein